MDQVRKMHEPHELLLTCCSSSTWHTRVYMRVRTTIGVQCNNNRTATTVLSLAMMCYQLCLSQSIYMCTTTTRLKLLLHTILYYVVPYLCLRCNGLSAMYCTSRHTQSSTARIDTHPFHSQCQICSQQQLMQLCCDNNRTLANNICKYLTYHNLYRPIGMRSYNSPSTIFFSGLFFSKARTHLNQNTHGVLQSLPNLRLPKFRKYGALILSTLFLLGLHLFDILHIY